MATQIELAAMRRALELAVDETVPTGPNPRVGAVILDTDGAIVGEGFHRGAGTPHAEVDALQRAGVAARGGTAVVTLEPCDHIGRTGACSQALIAAGVARVVFGQRDGNPVAAGGAATLIQAGLVVESDVLAGEAAAINPLWTLAIARARPFITWKAATSLDGFVAAADGSSRWITSPAARADVHSLRSSVDAVVVGTGTALADDPRLTSRDAMGRAAGRQPLRVVIGHRRLPADARLLTDGHETLLAQTHDVNQVMKQLFERDAQHVLLEGGPALAAAFLRAELIDRVVVYVAPLLLGKGLSMLMDLGIQSIDEGLRMDIESIERVGPDLRIAASPRYRQREQVSCSPA